MKYEHHDERKHREYTYTTSEAIQRCVLSFQCALSPRDNWPVPSNGSQTEWNDNNDDLSLLGKKNI